MRRSVLLMAALLLAACGAQSEGELVDSSGTIVLVADAGTDAETLKATADIVQERARALAQGADVRVSKGRIVVELPNGADRERLRRVLIEPGVLQFREVLDSVPAGDPGWTLTEIDDAGTQVVYADRRASRWYRLGAVELTGDGVRDAYANFDESGGWVVQLSFTDDAAKTFGATTNRLAPEHKQLAIVLDRLVESAPQVQQAIGNGQAQITGTFTEAEARELAIVLKSGRLPIRLRAA